MSEIKLIRATSQRAEWSRMPGQSMPCPTKDELQACLLGRIPAARAEVLLQHAERCDACAQLVESLDSSSDRVTQALRTGSSLSVSTECERMIDRAEVYVQGDVIEDSVASAKQHLLQGTNIRDYEIIRPIGEGGMGAVFLAHHKRLNRDVALKVLSLRRVGDREAQRRFEQEMSIVGKLHHAGIVRALDAGEHEGIQYLVMELIDGTDLREVVETLGPIPVADACEICRRAAEALDYAHGEQLIHRDVKPSNIMLSSEGEVKVMDLGLARFTDQHRSLTSTHQAMGSLDFMAPEQLRGDEVDHRADIYGLGCTLHYLLMAEPPEKRRTAALMISRNPRLDSVRGLLPPPLTRLLQQMLAVDVTKRCDSLADVADQLAPFCNRSNLGQLAAKAMSLVQNDVTSDSGSITSTIDNATQPHWKRRMLLAGLVVATTLAALAAWWRVSIDDQHSGSAARLELTEMPSVSSHIEPVREIPLFQIHDGPVRCVAFCEQTSQLICGSDDHSITIRDLPRQRRIKRIWEFDAPVQQLAVAEEVRVGEPQTRMLVVGLDRAGFVAAISLPEAITRWKVAPSEFATPPTRIAIASEQERVMLRLSDGTSVALSLHDGALEPPPRRTAVEQAAANSLAYQQAADLTVGGENLEMAVIDQPLGLICVVHDNLARLLELGRLREQHFIYAEHRQPICSVLALTGHALFFTADETGEIRLWQAPNRPRSDMLLACETKVDSAELTFQIHRQKKWSRQAFSESPDRETSEHNYHILEYRIKRDDE